LTKVTGKPRSILEKASHRTLLTHKPTECYAATRQQKNLSNIYTNNQQMPINIYNVFYSNCSHQHVSAGILAIFRVMSLLQEYKM